MQLHSRPAICSSSQKRLGRGYGSGKGGHTVGRGQKGQKSRTSIPAHFIGTSWVWFKRLPFMRGKSRFKPLSPAVTLTFSQLSKFKSGATVDKQTLYQQGLISRSELLRARVKLVNTGKLTKKLKIAIPATREAISTIRQAGGVYSEQTE